MKYFILAGGYGRRAEPLSLIKPKPVFPLNGVPLLSLLLRQLRAQGWPEGFINLHHLGDQVVAAAGDGRGIRFIAEKELSGSRVLRQALPFFRDWLLAINGDTYLDIPVAGLLARAAATDADGVLLLRADPEGRYAGLAVDGAGFLGLDGPPAAPGLMYAGVALFRPGAVAKFDDGNFFNSIRRHRLRLQTVVHDGLWLDLGTPESYLRANWEYQAHCRQRPANALSAGVEIAASSRVERSVLWENARIGPEVRLSECIVTSGMSLEKTRRRRQIITPGGVFPLL